MMKLAVVLAALGVIGWITYAQDAGVPQQRLSLLPIKPRKTLKAEAKPSEPIKNGTIWRYQSEVDPRGDQLVSVLSVSETGEKISFFSALASGRLSAPEADGVQLKPNHYQFSDSFGNKGKMTIKTLSEEQIEVSFTISEVSDPRSLMHYETQKYTIQAK